MYLSSEDVKTEDWSRYDEFPKLQVTCRAGHDFESHAKFSGASVAILSRDACPVCGEHALSQVHSSPVVTRRA